MRRYVFALLPFVLAAQLAFMPTIAWAEKRSIDLGETSRVENLFSFPNNCAVICYLPWSLEDTVAHYLRQSVQRDGYTEATVDVYERDGRIHAAFEGTPVDYGQRILSFLDAGDLAFAGAKELNAAGKWKFNWLFFLPLGMAVENHRSVELLHFPPDYSLTQAQNYLESATTDRWAELLTVNGIEASDTPKYQTIVDIAPIAAPASAGKELEGTYNYFDRYHTAILELWTRMDTDTAYPMVAFGAPVRAWIKTAYGVDIGVLGLATVTLPSGLEVPVVGSNHPSDIWYASDPKNYDGNEEKADAAGIKVMTQDLKAACWQARMGETPTASASTTLSGCESYWDAHPTAICERFYTKIRELSPEKAREKCTQG